jgi:subtilase family serine protease
LPTTLLFLAGYTCVRGEKRLFDPKRLGPERRINIGLADVNEPLLAVNQNIDRPTSSYATTNTESTTKLGGSSKIGRAPREHKHEVIFAIQQKNTDTLEDILLSVSDPFSPDYGNHFSYEEIVQLTANPDASSKLSSYLQSVTGVTTISSTLNGEYVRAEATVAVWERLFETKFYLYRRRRKAPNNRENKNGRKKNTMNPADDFQKEEEAYVEYIRADDYTIPPDIKEHVSMVLNILAHPPTMEINGRHEISLETHRKPYTKDMGLPIADTDTAAKRPLVAADKTSALRGGGGFSYSTNSIRDPNTVADNTAADIETIPRASENVDEVTGATIAARQLLSTTVYADTSTSGIMNPSKIWSLYSITNQTGTMNSTQGVYATSGQYFSPSDLLTFQQQFGLPSQNISSTVNGHVSDHACQSSASNCAMSNLQVQYMMAVSQHSPTTVWYSGDWVIDWVFDILNATSHPRVMTIGYGSTEPHMDLMKVFNTEAMKLGLQGVTLVAASGDDGALAPSDYSCTYSPVFPASSPYVLAVGATEVGATASGY